MDFKNCARSWNGWQSRSIQECGKHCGVRHAESCRFQLLEIPGGSCLLMKHRAVGQAAPRAPELTLFLEKTTGNEGLQNPIRIESNSVRSSGKGGRLRR